MALQTHMHSILNNQQVNKSSGKLQREDETEFRQMSHQVTHSAVSSIFEQITTNSMEQVASKPTPFADHHDDAASKAQQDGGKSFVVSRAPYFIIIKRKERPYGFLKTRFLFFLEERWKFFYEMSENRMTNGK